MLLEKVAPQDAILLTRTPAKLADLAVAKLEPITLEMNRLMKDPAEIDRILGAGADRADAIARPIVDQVYDKRPATPDAAAKA